LAAVEAVAFAAGAAALRAGAFFAGAGADLDAARFVAVRFAGACLAVCFVADFFVAAIPSGPPGGYRTADSTGGGAVLLPE
jgi:hypothetical protein